MNTFLSIATIPLLLVVGASGQGLYRHFSLLNKGTAVSSNGVIEKTIDFTWEVRTDPTNWTQVVETGLILEYERMQSFISEKRFDVDRFDAAVQDISQAFSGLMRIARVSILSNDQVYLQFGYCIRVFDEMVAATQILMAEKSSRTASDILIANIIDLYIRMFSMYTVQGTLDRRSLQIYETVRNFYVEFSTWSEKFWALSDIPPIERLLFLQYTTKFEIKIKDSMSQL
ncbi:hypothetical protein OXX69_000658 [Metschnikowia pulcherrima]